jgi:hypothetical protein
MRDLSVRVRRAAFAVVGFALGGLILSGCGDDLSVAKSEPKAGGGEGSGAAPPKVANKFNKGLETVQDAPGKGAKKK